MSTIAFTVGQGTGSGNYATGSAVAIRAYTPATGYRFSYWGSAYHCSVASSGSANTTAYLTTNPAYLDAYIYAYFVKITYSLTYSAGAGGSISGNDSQTVEHGASGSEVTAVAGAGYHFKNWSDRKTNASRTDGPITSNQSYTANFESDTPTYSLTVVNGTGSGSWAEAAVKAIVANAAPVDYHFDRWTGDVANVTNILAASTTITIPAAATTITATYALNSGLKKVAGVTKAQVKKTAGVALANIKKLAGISNE